MRIAAATGINGRAWVMLMGVVLLAGCASPPTAGSARIWDSRARAFVSEAALMGRLADNAIVLLGEIHDNPEHHAIQRRVLAARYARGLRPVLAMEQFDTEHAAALAAVLARSTRAASAGELAERGHFDHRGWEWQFYEPLISLALAHDAPVAAANLSRDALRPVMREGFSALGAATSAHLGLPPRLDATATAAMTAAIVAGHCGMLSAAQAPPMVRAQQARDAVMASVVAEHSTRGAVLIAGAGHVRRDVGVPFYLRARHQLDAVAIGLVESETLSAPPASMATLYDYMWLTQVVRRPDPCAAFREKPSAPR